MTNAPASSIAQRLAARGAYSWRRDPNVPNFDDTRPLIVFDGVCVLCSRSMRFVAGHEAAEDESATTLQFTAAQSPLGQALFAHFGLDVEAFETVLLIEHGRALGKRDAIAGIARLLRWPWRVAAAYGVVPRGIADRGYDVLANRRYRLFGRTDACMRPDPSWAARVIA